MSLFCQTATIYRATRTGTDAHGHAEATWGAVGEAQCRVSSVSAKELDKPGVLVTDKTVYFLGDAEVISTDQLTVDDDRYEIIGIESIYDGAGRVHHKRATARAVS